MGSSAKSRVETRVKEGLDVEGLSVGGGWGGMGGRGGRRSVPFYRLPINTPVPTLSVAVYGVRDGFPVFLQRRKYNCIETPRNWSIDGVRSRVVFLASYLSLVVPRFVSLCVRPSIARDGNYNKQLRGRIQIFVSNLSEAEIKMILWSNYITKCLEWFQYTFRSTVSVDWVIMLNELSFDRIVMYL